MTPILWFVAVASLLLGTGAITRTLVPVFPITWTWHHHRLRKPAAIALLVAGVVLTAWAVDAERLGLVAAAFPLAVVLLGVVLAFRLYQERPAAPCAAPSSPSTSPTSAPCSWAPSRRRT